MLHFYRIFYTHRKKAIYIMAIQNAVSEDSDQTARMRKLIWIFAGRACPKIRLLILRLIVLEVFFYYYFVNV